MVAKSASKLFDKELSDEVPQSSPLPGAQKMGRNLTYTIGNAGNETSQLDPNQHHLSDNVSSNAGKELSNFCENFVRPTPDEKKRSYFPKNLSVRLDCENFNDIVVITCF